MRRALPPTGAPSLSSPSASACQILASSRPPPPIWRSIRSTRPLPAEYTSTTRDLCTNAIPQGHLLPGVSSDILIARLQLMLSRRYRCLAKEMLHSPARQEVLANTHRQIREINTYIRSFKEDLPTRATALPYAEQSTLVGNRFLTLFSPSVDALLGNNTGPVPGGVTIADLPCPGGFGTPPAAAPAAKRSLLKPAPAASFGPTPTVPLDGSPPAAARSLAGPRVTVLALADLPPLRLRRPAGSGPIRRLPSLSPVGRAALSTARPARRLAVIGRGPGRSE
jgi:hypothetical protein